METAAGTAAAATERPPRLRVSAAHRALLAISNLGVYCCIASFIISSPVLYTVYFGGDATAIGAIGVAFGFFNALNGLPIAEAADAGVLNRRCRRCFPSETCGRRAPWIVLGVPVTAAGAVMLWIPPVRSGSPGAAEAWYGVVYFVIAMGFTAALQSIMATVQELMHDAREIAVQTGLGQPVNLVSYTIAGLVAPAIAFTEAPPSDMTGGCCVQPLQRCDAYVGLDCGCYANASQLFVPAMARACAATATNSSVRASFSDNHCSSVDEDKRAAFSMSNFAVVGVMVGAVTLVSLLAVIPARHTPYGRTDHALTKSTGNVGKSFLSAFRLRSFRWNALANIFANINEQATVQLLPFFLIYVVGSDFRDVGAHNSLVAGSTLGAALVGVVLFAWALSRTRTKDVEGQGTLTLPLYHPANFMAGMSLLKLAVSLPLAILSGVYRSVNLLAGSAVMGGVFTGGQSQVTAILLGWVMDDDEASNGGGGGGMRREGLILSANAMVQHMSFVTVSLIIALWGALGLDTSKCPSAQPQRAIDAIFYSYTVLNGLWLLSYSAALLFYPIRGEKLEAIVSFKKRSIRDMEMIRDSGDGGGGCDAPGGAQPTSTQSYGGTPASPHSHPKI